MKLTRCPNLHFYDMDKYDDCPHCSVKAAPPKASGTMTETRTETKNEPTQKPVTITQQQVPGNGMTISFRQAVNFTGFEQEAADMPKESAPVSSASREPESAKNEPEPSVSKETVDTVDDALNVFAKLGNSIFRKQISQENKFHKSANTAAPVPQPQPAPVPQPKPAPVPQPKPAPVPQPQPAPAPQPKPAPVPQPQPAPAPQPKPAPVPQPKPAPVPQPKPAPVPQPKPAPVPQPKPATVPQPKPATVPQPKPATVPQPKPAPAPQPKPAPVPQPKSTPVPQPSPSVNNLAQAVAAAKAKPAVDDGKTVAYYQFADAEPVVGWIIGISGFYFGDSFNLKAGHNFIGRSLSMDVPLVEEKSVSREYHANVIFDPKSRRFFIQPGKSSGLTYLNNNLLLTPAELHVYDKIQFGDSTYVFMPFCGRNFTWDDYANEG